MMPANTFDLEQKILSCWNITDDLDLIIQGVKAHKLSTDEAMIMLTGLKNLYHLKFDDLFEEFSKVTGTYHE